MPATTRPYPLGDSFDALVFALRATGWVGALGGGWFAYTSGWPAATMAGGWAWEAFGGLVLAAFVTLLALALVVFLQSSKLDLHRNKLGGLDGTEAWWLLISSLLVALWSWSVAATLALACVWISLVPLHVALTVACGIAVVESAHALHIVTLLIHRVSRPSRW